MTSTHLHADILVPTPALVTRLHWLHAYVPYACRYDIYMPASGFVVLITTAIVLLAFCVRDPH